MNPVKHLFIQAPAVVTVVIAMVFSIIVELLVFNHHFFTSRAGDEGFAYKNFELPVHPQTGTRILVMDHKHNELTLDGINMPLASIRLTARMDSDKVVTVQVLARAAGDEYRNISSVKINPAREHQNSGTIHFSHADAGRVFEDLKIVLTAHRGFTAAITGIEFNAPEKLAFSWTRYILISLLLMGAALTVRFRLHEAVLDERLRSHRALNHGVVAMALAVCTFFFWASYPKNSNPYYFDFYGEAVYPFNDRDQSLLLPLPDTIEENNAAGPYEQLLSAMLKGQLNINVFVDPRIESLKNPYDTSERNHSGVTYTWDRPYYQGKYFVYFGITPLFMVYAPCYALTGMIPSPAVAIYIMSIMAALSLLWAFRAVVRALVASPNLMLYLLSQLAGLSSSMLWIIHTGLSFYFLPYMAVMVWMSLYTAAIFSMMKPASPLMHSRPHGKTTVRALLLLAGISIPMVVSSRPLALILLIPLTVPAIITIIRENYSRNDSLQTSAVGFIRNTQWPDLIRDSLFAIVPVFIGAALVMVYNYVRFDSVSEFGQTYQFTFDDVSSKGLYFGWAHLRNVLYYFFFEPMVWTREFPFVFASETILSDHGNQVFAGDRLSLFTFPVLWALWLALRSRKGLLSLTCSHMKPDSSAASWTAVLDARMGMLRTTAVLTGAAMVFVAYASYYNAAVTTRYLCEIAVTGTYLSIVLALLNCGSHPAANSSDRSTSDHQACPAPVSSPDNRSAFLSAFWALGLFFILKTMIVGLLLPLSYIIGSIHLGTVLNEMNPALILDLYRILTPFGH